MKNQKTNMVNPVVEACLKMCYNQPEGCLFVVELAGTRGYYMQSNIQIFKKSGRRLSVLNKGDAVLIRRLAGLDGAIIVSNRGELMQVGATLVHSKNFLSHGKRHAFALGTSAYSPNLVCLLASEEDKHIRTFREGFLVANINSETKVPVTTRSKVVELLTSRITSLVVASGIAASLLTVNPIPAIVTISGTQVITFEGFERVREFFFGRASRAHSAHV